MNASRSEIISASSFATLGCELGSQADLETGVIYKRLPYPALGVHGPALFQMSCRRRPCGCLGRGRWHGWSSVVPRAPGPTLAQVPRIPALISLNPSPFLFVNPRGHQDPDCEGEGAGGSRVLG